VSDVAKVVTWLGAPQVAWPVLGLFVAVLAIRGRRLEAAWLLAGLALTILFVHEIKIWVDRPRPAHPLVHTSGKSFPSGHAAYAGAYVAAALALRRRRPVIAAVLIAVVVAWSRVELRAHFVTDVLGGAALTALCFGLTWLVVARLRHNGEA
jgi:membrane-associated phospholipid phosphatase